MAFVFAHCLPAPDIQSDFDAIFDWKTSVPTFGVTRPITSYVLPENSVAFNWLERYTFNTFVVSINGLVVFAINKSTPGPVLRYLKAWEVGPTSSAIGV